VSQLLLAIPMCLLYEFGIIMAQLMERFVGKRPSGEESTPDTTAGTADPAEAEQKRLQ